jgi:hypothetical protein
MKDDGIQERYGNDDETKWIFKQQVEQSHGLYPDRIPYITKIK